MCALERLLWFPRMNLRRAREEGVGLLRSGGVEVLGLRGDEDQVEQRNRRSRRWRRRTGRSKRGKGGGGKGRRLKRRI